MQKTFSHKEKLSVDSFLEVGRKKNIFCSFVYRHNQFLHFHFCQFKNSKWSILLFSLTKVFQVSLLEEKGISLTFLQDFCPWIVESFEGESEMINRMIKTKNNLPFMNWLVCWFISWAKCTLGLFLMYSNIVHKCLIS